VLVAVGDRAAAEDAVAEAFTRAYAHWPRLAEHPNPTAWVLRTALNTQRSWWRRLRREVSGEPPDWPSQPVDSPHLSSQLKSLVKGLPRRQREVVALRLLADLSAEETGALLGITPATVHVHLHRALATLRGSLAGLPSAEEVQ
jgi:RNA polymerase sigma-70 factor (ECF subfamily)